MKITEAKEALCSALNDIAAMASKFELNVNVSCSTANHDLETVSDDSEDAAIISGEISVGNNGAEENLIFECALSITDGEVSEEEIAREVSTVRGSMTELCEKLDGGMETSEAFTAVLPEEEAPVQAPAYDNKKFYIYGSIIAAAIVIILILGRLL